MTKKAKKAASEEQTELKNLGNLSPAPGSNKNKKRLGRGIGSGTGKTAGKGHKGLKARKGSGPRIGFEGGQMPLYMRLPKRGFHNKFRTHYNVINLDNLNSFADGATVDSKALDEKGLLRRSKWPVKLLGRGKLEKKLNITVAKASASVKEAVEKTGGTLKIVEVVKLKLVKPAKKKK